MSSMNLQAVKVYAGQRFTLVETLDPETGKKGVIALKGEEDKARRSRPHAEYFMKMVKNFFTDYENYFDIL